MDKALALRQAISCQKMSGTDPEGFEEHLRQNGYMVIGIFEPDNLRAELAAERERVERLQVNEGYCSELCCTAQICFDAVVRQRDAALAALRVCHHDLTTTHNLRATDLSIKAFNDALARGVPRETTEWMIDNSKALAAIDAALNKGGGE